MKTNSKLYKRVLAIALAVCMLCSVLVAGIGTGITAKAADGFSVKLNYQETGSWASGSATGTFGKTGGTVTLEINSSKTNDGEINLYAEVADVYDLLVEKGYSVDDVTGSATVYFDGVETSHTGFVVESGEKLQFCIYNPWNPTIGTTKATFNSSLKVVLTMEWPEVGGSEESGSDTPAATANAKFYYTDTGSWKNIEKPFTYAGSGTYKFTVLPDAVGGTPAVGPNNYIQFPDIAAALTEAGYTTADATVTITVKMDGVEVATNAIFDFDDNQAKIFNPWGGVGTIDTNWTEKYEVIVDIQLPTELGTGSCDVTIGSTPAEEPDDDDEEELKGTTGTKKENGYVHDKGAIFVYTGSKDIHDFTIASGWVFGKVHEINGKWGDSFFNAGGLAGSGNDGTKVKGNGIYIKYWDDYRGIGYPAIQLSWDTDRIFYIGDITVYSSDWSTQAVFSVGDGFYRGPEERYAGTGEALLDGSNKWYYFGEGSYTAATTTPEDDKTETVDTSNFTNGAIECGDGEAAAYIMYADESWTNQYWYDGSVYTMNPENAKITGEGDYVVGLSGSATGLAFTALGIDNGEATFPEYCFTITAMTVNGKLINFDKPYTSSDDQKTTRSNIYNAWVSELPEDARCAYGELTDCTPTGVKVEDFASVNEFKVYFTVTAPETELDYNAKVVETLTNLVNDGTLAQADVDQYLADNGIQA